MSGKGVQITLITSQLASALYGLLESKSFNAKQSHLGSLRTPEISPEAADINQHSHQLLHVGVFPS